MDVDAMDQHEITPSNAPKPHDILWFPDGDVVLLSGSYLFKVHKCILSLQSSVFRDMFAFPIVDGIETADNGTGTASEKYEGLPLVALSGDKGGDVVHLLRTVYDRQYYHRDDNETPLAKITALLVLSTKYDFQGIRTDVIVQISRHYPMVLDEYCDVDDDLSPLFGTERQLCHYPLLFAALQADVDFLLPVLYYACSDFTTEGICDEFESDSAELQSFKTLIKGRDTLQESTTEFIAKLPENLRRGKREDGCKALTTSSCRKSAYFNALDTFCNSTDLGDIRGTDVVEKLRHACEECTQKMSSLIDKKRQEIWGKLPSFFGLPLWDVLLEKKDKMCFPNVD